MELAPRVWSIAGLDSSGGAGVHADQRAFEAFGLQGGYVVTGVVAQNARRVHHAEWLSPEVVRAQFRSLLEMGRPAAVKIGALGNAAIAQAVADELRAADLRAICDPVLFATSGGALGDATALREFVLPVTSVLTPNQQEAAHFPDGNGYELVVKGGHLPDETLASDRFRGEWISAPRRKIEWRGTGCLFSAALASAFALGYEGTDAVVLAKIFLSRTLRLRATPPWPDAVTSEDLPWIGTRRRFPPADPIGFYPIADRASRVAELAAAGAHTIQLRIKDLDGARLEAEIEMACRLPVRLYVNDYWDLALRHRAYGVHLGQEDAAALPESAWAALEKSGVRLGLSTHSWEELARAHAYGPSYVALGPVFPTLAKPMRFGPQGLARLALWKRLSPYPVVAIGGMKAKDAEAVLATGADGIAVLGDAVGAARARKWVEFFHGSVRAKSQPFP